ncbi:MAG: winged helix-turn-helix transcriptional regulator, partial [Acidobacteriaceae bacterium]|nr:winged helix-turn-helix transcriptional regulator [Acidobacteriaceae bacterium]
MLLFIKPKRVIKTDSPISVRHQLRDLLVKKIEERNYLPGQRFPSERELAAKYGISRASVRETVAQLLAQGVLVRSNGRGTFVSERAPDAVAAGTRTGTVGFWISEQVFHFVQTGYNQILSGVTEVCHASGRHLRFLPLRDGLLPADLPRNVQPDT